MSGIRVTGWGAVSPAGHGVNALRAAAEANIPLPTTTIDHPGRIRTVTVRRVQPPSPRPPFLAHPRLRRSSAISIHAAAASIEALGTRLEGIERGNLRLGVVYATQTGCVSYCRRFYQEVLEDPSTASPILFPETVFNAPASHLATYLGSNGINYTLIGDPGTFLQGMAIAAQWLTNQRIDVGLVVGAEEIDWIVPGAQRLFDRDVIVSEGAGALVLERADDRHAGILLDRITEPVLFGTRAQQVKAARTIRDTVAGNDTKPLLLDSRTGVARVDRAETEAWSEWPGARCSVKRALGESYAAASAWQCVLAADSLAQGHHASVIVNVVGCNQQAIAARFVTAP